MLSLLGIRDVSTPALRTRDASSAETLDDRRDCCRSCELFDRISRLDAREISRDGAAECSCDDIGDAVGLVRGMFTREPDRFTLTFQGDRFCPNRSGEDWLGLIGIGGACLSLLKYWLVLTG
jgi:hypothetical protein